MVDDEDVADAPTCDECGAPATTVATDLLVHEVPGAVATEYSQLGAPKHGCNAHPVRSETHFTELPPRK